MYTGSCHCKNIKFKITGAVDTSAAPPCVCYCDHCAKFSGSVGGIIAIYKPQDITFEGDMTVYTDKSSDSGQDKTVHFCGTCGSLVYTQPKSFGDLICLRSPLIDGEFPAELYPQMELYPEKKPQYLNLNSVKQ